MFGKNQTRWYIYTWVLFSTHVWILTHMYGKKHTCVKKAIQLYICKRWAFSTHVWEKPLTCLFPPELWVGRCNKTRSPLTSLTICGPGGVRQLISEEGLVSNNTIRSDTILRIELRSLQCAEGTIDKFGMRLIGLLPNSADPWPRRRASPVCEM